MYYTAEKNPTTTRWQRIIITKLTLEKNLPDFLNMACIDILVPGEIHNLSHFYELSLSLS
jgi:hypothetical protein